MAEEVNQPQPASEPTISQPAAAAQPDPMEALRAEIKKERAGTLAGMVEQQREEKAAKDRKALRDELKQDREAERAEAEQQEGTEAQAQQQQAEQESNDPRVQVAKALGFTAEDMQNPRVAALVDQQLGAMQAQADNAQLQAQRAEQALLNPQTPEEYTGAVQSLTAEITTPESVNAVAAQLAPLFGASPDNPEAMANMQQAVRIGAAGFISLAIPAMQRMFGQMAETQYPGIGQRFADASRADAWDEARAEVEANLPDYGTKAWKEAVTQAVEKNPWLRSVSGMRESALAVARVLGGEKVTPQTVTQAAQKAVKQYQQAEQAVRTAQITGSSGKSTGEFRSGQKPDPIMDNLRAEIARHRAESSVLSRKK